MRREYDEEHDKRSEELGAKVETLEREVSILRMLLSREIVGIMIGPATQMND